METMSTVFIEYQVKDRFETEEVDLVMAGMDEWPFQRVVDELKKRIVKVKGEGTRLLSVRSATQTWNSV